MKPALPILTTVFIALTTLGVGALHGRWSNRWGTPANPEEVRTRIESIPLAFGDWETKDSQEFHPQVIKTLQCVGYINRSYVNRKTAEVVQVALLAGPSGPISVHTPEVCYPALALDEFESKQKAAIRPNTTPNESFHKVMFRSRGLDANYLRVWYAWRGEEGPWDVPTLPRVAFSSQPILYKLQVGSASQTEPTAQSDDACQSFLNEFLPVLDNSLFRPAPKVAASP